MPARDVLRDKSNRHAEWAEAGPRLAPQAWPAFQPSFVVPAGGTVFTIGSCFARNIEEHVARLGFRVPTLSFAVPEAERAGGRDNAVLNKYTPAAIRQEFDWTRRILEKGGVVEAADVADIAFRCADGLQIDLQLGGFRPVTPERLLARRQALFDVFREAFTADCVVMTLGLIETWHDGATGLAIQQAPAYAAFRRSLDRFSFRRLDFASCRADVQAAIDSIRAINPAANVLITTSPVPLDRTFTSEDVVTATMHGKSVLRAVCGEIVASNERVDYFPSYESVMLTRDWSVFQNDRRHVSDAFVGKIVLRLVDTYFREASIEKRMAHAAYMAALAGEAVDSGALRALAESSPQDVRAFVRYLTSLAGSPDELAAAAGRFVAAGATPEQLVRLARSAKRDEASAATVVGALVAATASAAGETVVAPRLAELWTLWIQSLLREERFAEALDASADALRRWPDHPDLSELATVADRRARRAGVLVEEPDTPPPVRHLAEAMMAGEPGAIASAVGAVLDGGHGAEAVVRTAHQAKRAAGDGAVSPALAAVLRAVEGRDDRADAAFAPLWRMLAQAQMREDRVADAVATIVDAVSRWPDDETLAEFSAQVERKARRAGLPQSVLAAFEPPPPPKSPADLLADAIAAGVPGDIRAAAAAALEAGVGPKVIVMLAHQTKRAGQESVVSPTLAALVDGLAAGDGSPDPAFLPLWRYLSQALWREGRRSEALDVARAADALWPDEADAAALREATERKFRKHGEEAAAGKTTTEPSAAA